MSAGFEQFRQFKPAGPVAAQFLSDTESKVKFLRGPIGGGKTVTCTFDCPKQAARLPLCRDGQIHVRGTVIGSTYGQLERNLYPTWKFWLPPGGANSVWEGGGGRFARHHLKFDILRDGQRARVNLEMIFAAIGELSVEQFVRGYEPTFWWLFETDLLPDGIVEEALGRLGRFPNAEMRLPGTTADDYPSWVMGDLNAPDIDSWYYKLVEEIRPPGLTQYVQPSGLSSDAENLQNLSPTYYQDHMARNGHRPKWVKRFIKNEYGPTEVGQPVYPEYSDAVHLASEVLVPDPKRGLYLGFDQGLTQPACVVLQRGGNGQWRLLREIVPGRMNGRRFGQLVRAELAEFAPHCRIEAAYADPAGFGGVDTEAGETAWAETVGQELGTVILPAPTNEIDARLTAVKDELSYMVDNGQPALTVSPACTMTRKGFASHYIFSDRPAEAAQYGKPIKNVYSNPHDGLQYILLGIKGRHSVVQARSSAGVHVPAGGVVTKIKSDFLTGW